MYISARLFWICFGLGTIVSEMSGQTDPGGIPGLNLWLKADAGLYTDSFLTSSSGLYAPVGIWTDQSGIGNHAFQNNGPLRPLLIPNDFNGMPAVRFLPWLSLGITTLPFLDQSFQSAISVYFVQQSYNEATVLSDGSLNFTASVSGIRFYNFQTPLLSASSNTVQSEYGPGVPVVEEFIYDGTTSSSTAITDGVTYYNRQPATGALQVWGGITLGGNAQGKNLFQGDIAEVLVFNRALNGAERQLVKTYLKTKYGVSGEPTGTTSLVFDGDSVTRGVGATAGGDYPTQLLASLGSGYSLADIAVPGQTTAGILAGGANADKQLHASQNNVLLVMGGTNDLAQSLSPDDLYNNLAAYCQARRAAGYRVIVLSLLPANAGAGYEVQRQAVNQRLRSGWVSFADAFVDVGSDPAMGDPNAPANGVYFSDGYHPNNLGYAIIASLVKPAVASVLQQFDSCVTGVFTAASTFAAFGGSGTLQVSPAGCAFRVSSDSTWLGDFHYVAGSPSEIAFTVAPSGAGADRVGNVAIGGQTVAIAQSGSTGGVPSIDSVSPAGGSGARSDFTFSFADTEGFAALRNLTVAINGTASNVQGCSVVYDPAAAAFSLWDDGGAALLGPSLPGTGRILRNSQCALDTNGSYASGQNNSLELTLSLSFFPVFRGLQGVYSSASDVSGGATGWQKLGTWTPNYFPAQN